MKLNTIHTVIQNYEKEKIILNSYAEEDRYECIDDIYNAYYIDDLKLLAEAFSIDLGDIDWNDIGFNDVVDIERLINKEVDKYYKSIDDELKLINDIIRGSDLTETMPNEIEKYLNLEQLRFGVDVRLNQIQNR